MRLTYLTGRAWDVQGAVNERVREALSGPRPIILLVPAQFTLQAERDALGALELPGSFQLQVLSPERLYARVFDEAGWPRETRIDEQGRVMLLHAAAERLKKQLVWYRSAVGRPGFAERALAQIATFKQAGLTPADIREQAGHLGGALSGKLMDLALLYEAYEQALAGRYMDGEDEQRRAARLMGSASFLREAHLCAHGFDLVTPALNDTLIALAGCAHSVTLALTLTDDPTARDGYLYEPVRRSLNRLTQRAREAGIVVTHERAARAEVSGTIGFLESELFAVPARKLKHAPSDVCMALCKDVSDEAEYAAAVARWLARTRGLRYRDIGIVCWSQDERAMDALKRAFARSDVPLFLAAGRSADKHPLAQCVLSALRMASHGFETNDVIGYLRAGFSGLTDDEADLLVNHALRYALRGKRWREPLALPDEEHGEDGEDGEDGEGRARLEPLREKLMTPLLEFTRRMRDADTTRARLTAVYELLDDLHAYETLEQTRAALQAQGLGSWAMEGAQVWKRILDALDQMEELLGGEKLSTQSIYELLRRALRQAVVKALPQSADAVEGGSLDHLKGKPVKALIIVGASDADMPREAQLLDDVERKQLPDQLSALTDEDRGRMRRIRLKSLLSMTGEYLLVTRAQSDASGRALMPGALMHEMTRLLPGIEVRGGVTYDAEMTRVKLEQPDVALARMSGLLKGGSHEARVTLQALESLPEKADAIARLRAAAKHRVHSEPLPDALREALCAPKLMSVSRLEQFAQCPFKHFAQFVLKPEEFHAFELSPRDAGQFYHAALEAFVLKNGARLGEMSVEDSQSAMDDITGALARHMHTATALAAHEMERLRGVARRAAAIVTRQFDGSRFRPVAVEADLVSGDVRFQLDESSALSGRIDRVDVWEDADDQYVRVIDYKAGARRPGLMHIYHGLELQLIIYLAAALKARGGKPAGVFYFHVSDPCVNTDEREAAAVEETREKQLSLKGLVLNDERVVGAMAARADLSVNVAFTKNGGLRAAGNLLTEADFDALIEHTLSQARLSVRQIRAGDTSIAPAVTSTTNACEHCDLSTLCQFDARLLGAVPRRMPALTDKQVLDVLRGSTEERE